MSGPRGAAARGWFITIEGPEGGGKTTQAARLAQHLTSTGRSVLVTREPGGTWLGERIRELLLARRNDDDAGGADRERPQSEADPLADAFLFNAARRRLVAEVIRPALASGTTVVCARFADSTLAYQGYGAGVGLDRLRTLADVATDGLVPDLTFVLDLPVDAGLARKAPGDVTRFEAEFDIAFHDRVRAGFLALAAAEPGRFVVIDAAAALDEVTAAMTAALDERLVGDGPSGGAVPTHR